MTDCNRRGEKEPMVSINATSLFEGPRRWEAIAWKASYVYL